MSSICSNDESILSSNRERRLHDFPLSSRSLHDTEHNVAYNSSRANRLARDVQTLARELSLSQRERTTPNSQNQLSYGSSNPLLRKIVYREQHEKEFERSFEYLQIQRRILKYVDKRGTAITAQQAYKWTANIVAKYHTPQPIQALRLCYYMRSFGFDTFAVIKPTCDPETGVDDTSLKLFVANPNSKQRGMGHDHLYWAQRIGTGKVTVRPYDTERSTRPRLRIDIGPPLTDTINQAFEDRFGGMVRMRGGGFEEVFE